MTRLASCLVLSLALLAGGCGSNATPETDATTAPFGDTVVIAALTDAMILGAKAAVLEAGLAESGDRVIIVAGVPPGVAGTTNMIKVDTL
jgi:hypothetical protein